MGLVGGMQYTLPSALACRHKQNSLGFSVQAIEVIQSAEAWATKPKLHRQEIKCWADTALAQATNKAQNCAYFPDESFKVVTRLNTGLPATESTLSATK